MQTLTLLPALVIGLIYAIQFGTWLFFAAVAISFLVSLLVRRRVGDRGQLEIDEGGLLRFDGRVVSKFPIFWQSAQRDAVFRMLATPSSEDVCLALDQSTKAKVQQGELTIGVTKELAPLQIQLNQNVPHLLIIGPTGSGKSLLMRSLARTAQPIIDIDFKGGGNLAGIAAIERLTNLDANAVEFWNGLNELLDEREASQKQRHHNLYVFVDELAATLASSALAAKSLERIATRGRSSSVFLIAASQSTAGIPRNIILNCQHRVLMGSVDPVDRTQLGAKGTGAPLAFSEDQLSGEYLHSTRQIEFLILRPSETAVSTPPQLDAAQNPLSAKAVAKPQ